jgi:hypothetical protein
VRDIREDFDELYLQPVLATAGALAHDERVTAVLEDGWRRHPVQGLVATGIRVHEHRAVVLQHQQARRLGQKGVQAAGVGDLAAGNDQAHAANLPSLSDMSVGV